MNKILLGTLLTAATGGTAVGVAAARQTPTVRANVYVGPVAVGGLVPEEAGRRLRVWWDGERRKELSLVCSATKAVLPSMTPTSLGVGLDDAGIVADLPMAGMTDALSGNLDRIDLPLKYKPNGANLVPIASLVKEKIGAPKAAQVRWEGGRVRTTPETSIMRLDAQALPEAVVAALQGDRTVDLPLKEGTKHVPDAALAQIRDVVAEYTTRFPASNRPRTSNIKLAASKLDGVILMPGERLSFNGTVGRRTLKGGFKEAGVYKAGKHDVGVGGGICQVSTTLYNASLFANLKIRQRSNHSLPVAYVPLGRDATVDYGSLDLVVENTTGSPIGVVNTYRPGQLTFRVLGKKDPSLSVKMVQENGRSWTMPVRTITDRRLAPGSRRIVEPGSSGHSVSTYRLVYRNGKLVERQALGRSSYGGGTRVVAVGPAAPPKPKATPAPAASASTVDVPPVDEIGDGL